MTTVDGDALDKVTEAGNWLADINLRHYNGPSNKDVRAAVIKARASVEAARVEIESRMPLELAEEEGD